MDAAALISALEALDGAALAQHAARLTRLAERSSQHAPPGPAVGPVLLSLEALPDALIARVLSNLPAKYLGRVAQVSSAFKATHVPAAIAVCIARLQLPTHTAGGDAYDYQKPIDLLIAETETASAARAANLVRSGYMEAVCHASARALDAVPAAMRGEFVFSLSLINLFYRPLTDGGMPYPDYAAGPAYKYAFYTHADVVPTFPLTEAACEVLKNPRAAFMASWISDDERPHLDAQGSEAIVCAQVSVTQATTGKTAVLWQGTRFGDDDPEDVEVTHLMPMHHISAHDEMTHGGFMAGITKYYLNLRAEGVFDAEFGNEGEEDQAAAPGTAGAAASERPTPAISLGMWSEVHSPGPWGGECYGNDEWQRFGQDDLHDKFVCLLRNINF